MHIQDYVITEDKDRTVTVDIKVKHASLAVYESLLTWHPDNGYTWHTENPQTRILVEKALNHFVQYQTLINMPGYQNE